MKENKPLMFIENIQNGNVTTPNQDYFDSRNKGKKEENNLFIEEKNIIKDNFLFFEKCYKAYKIGVEITLTLDLDTGKSVTGIVKNISKNEILIGEYNVKISEVTSKNIIKTEII